jgi:biopolymer transport protein ExbB
MANAPTKPTSPVKKESSSASGMFATLTIPICIIVAIIIFIVILGDASHYEGGDVEKGNPNDFFGRIHRGGNLVPVIMSYLLMVIVFSIERFVVIGKASGTSSIDTFVRY